MTQQKPEDQINELTDEQLDTVSAGTPPKETSKPATPPKTHGAIEITDYGFGVSMPVTS
jgi:hypothetical protein